jgi:hypothetical protein
MASSRQRSIELADHLGGFEITTMVGNIFFCGDTFQSTSQQEKLEISTENYFEDTEYLQNPSFGGFEITGKS